MANTNSAPAANGDSGVTGTPPASYEAAMAELEALVASMESGALPLEESLAAYRRGAELVRYCQQMLERVEQQVKVLEGDTLKPMAAAADNGQADNE